MLGYMLAAFLAPTGLALGGGPSLDAEASRAGASTERVHVCYPGENGILTGQLVRMPVEPEFLKIKERLDTGRGVVDNRVDLVFVGDGYQAGEMALYHQHVNTVSSQFFQYEPYITYEPYFRITAVEVVSVDSGVDNDPVQGIDRDTAMDMAYWGHDIERLLVIDVTKAYTYASAGSADVDQILAVANSSKYGGAGYVSSNLGTLAGGNAAAVDIAIHENGHTLGDLADEYTYGGPATYTGPEHWGANASIYNQAQQIADSRKWYRWMGASMAGFDGTVGAYEGASYSVNGIYRPTNNSMMRALGRPFNLPSAERTILEIYREVNPIDAGLMDGAVVNQYDLLWVTPMQPVGHSLDITWSIDGVQDPALDGATSVDVSSLGLAPGDYTVSVTVVDNTPWVRDPAYRDNFLTETRSYTVTVDGCGSIADLTGDGIIDIADVFAFLDAYNTSNFSVADLTGDGIIDIADVFAFLNAYNAGC